MHRSRLLVGFLVIGILSGWGALATDAAAQSDAATDAPWIGLPASEGPTGSGPRNRFTYFRKVVTLDEVPDTAAVRFAADSNARLWINGHLVRRKVARYAEEHATAEVVNAAPYLREGQNVVVALHHNWGDIVTFQRTGNERLGLYLSGSWIATDSTWRMTRAPQFVQHEKQIIGVPGTGRVRYPQIVDAREDLQGDLHDSSFDVSGWRHATEIDDGPWPATPPPVETPGQREHPVRPMAVLAAGTADRDFSDDPAAIAKNIRDAQYRPDSLTTDKAIAFVAGQPAVIEGAAGETRYVTFDFFRPLHGYPYLKLAEAPAGTAFDFGYAEIPRSAYSGRMQVNPETGWVDPTGVVGDRYADRYITRAGSQSVEIPDERTARWMTVLIRFPEAGRVVIEDLGIVKSQYPVDWVGTFATGDEHIDQIIKLALIHAELNMTDAYIDTPGREDEQWLDDSRLRAVIGARWFGDTRLREFFLRSVAESQRPDDGRFHDFPPTNYPAFVSTYDWNMQWVAMLYDQYRWSGDTGVIRTYWDNLTRFWDDALSHLDENGVWRTSEVRGDIRVGQPPEEGQSSGIVTAGLIERLHWSAEMAEAIEEEEQALDWHATAQRMAEAFRQHHVVAATDQLPAHVADRYDPQDSTIARGFSQAGQTMAVYTGLLTDEQAREVLRYAFPKPFGAPPEGVTRWNNPTFSYRVLRALSHGGLTERAVQHMIERYSQYLPGHPANPVPLELQGPYGGPLPEYWISRQDRDLAPGDTNTAQPVDPTGSHGWAAVPLAWLHDTLLGVQIAEPGGGTLRISPQTGGLPFVQGYTATPKGRVWVSYKPQRWQVEVVIPEGVIATVVLPPAFEGKQVAIREQAGTAREADARTFEVEGGGRYVFEAR